MSKAVLLYSDGLEATTILYAILQHNKTVLDDPKLDEEKLIEVFPLLTNYGQHHSVELHFAKALLKETKLEAVTKTFDINWESFRGQIKENNHSAVHPHRNVMLITIASAYATSIGADTVYVCCSASDQKNFPDCRHEFLETLQKTLRLSSDNKNFFIKAPLLSLDKSEILAFAAKYNVPINKVWYCYRPVPETNSYKPCGQCEACIDMKTALAKDCSAESIQGDLVL